jgi:AcrR family transcriptional regulator
VAVRSGAKNGRAVDKRRAIMRAAEGLFAGRRYHEVTLDAVARIAGVSKGTIYNHFKDKEDLFFQLVTSGFKELCGVLKEKLPPGAGFREQLAATAREVTRFFEARLPLFRMMIAEAGHVQGRRRTVRERWLEHRKRLIDAVACVMKRGIADGEVRRRVPARSLASFFLGLLRARAFDRDHAGIPAVGDAALVDLFYAGACGEIGCAARPRGNAARAHKVRARTRASAGG